MTLTKLLSNISLKGQSVTVKGNLTQSGDINISGGKLIVEGDYNVHDSIIMQNPNDYVLVNGNLTISTSAEATLKSGVIEVKGNITKKQEEIIGLINEDLINYEILS